MNVLRFALAAVFISSAPAMAAQSRLSKKLQRIEQACKLATGTLTAVGDEVHFAPSPNEKYENVDCALAKLKRGRVEKMGFVGNEADPNRALSPGWSYVAGGTISALTALADEARKAGWIAGPLAKADDGTGFLPFHTPEGMTEAQATPFANRLWKHELGDITFGQAPSRSGSGFNGE